MISVLDHMLQRNYSDLVICRETALEWPCGFHFDVEAIGPVPFPSEQTTIFF